MNILNGKTCNGCGEHKEPHEFSKCRRTNDGLQYKCKQCNKKTNKKFRNENPDYYSYEVGYFSKKEKWEYISLYQKADKSIKIYMISFDDGSKYIGSTKGYIHLRLARHVCDFRYVRNGNKKKLIPLLHEKFKEFDSDDAIREHIMNNTVVIEECSGSKTKQYRLEAQWILKLQKRGETLLNKMIPRRYSNMIV